MNVMTALLISLAISVLVCLTYVASGLYNPLMTGFITGVILGEPEIGLAIGAICTLMSIGFYTYGGTVIPSYGMGSIFAVVVAVQSGDYNQGIVIGSVVALLGSWFDILQGLVATYLLHRADKSLEMGNVKGMEVWHLSGLLTIIATNFIPVFLGLLIIDRYEILMNFVQQYAWIEQGLTVVGSLLPAVGFALLLSFMDVKGYWPFMVSGYVLFAYLDMPTIGLALLGIAIAFIYLNRGKEGVAKDD